MPTILTLPFNTGTTIAYVVRDKPSHGEAPPDAGHSDCILPSGAPVGYFGRGGIQNWGALAADGVVFTYSRFLAGRPHYVNMADAKSRPCLSTLLLMDVGRTRADRFRASWLAMRAKTDGFTIAGNNCSTHASRACFAAGIIASAEVSGTDTPNNLYEQIVDDGRVPWRSHTGYLSFKPRQTGTDEMSVDYEVTIEVTGLSTVGGPSVARW